MPSPLSASPMLHRAPGPEGARAASAWRPLLELLSSMRFAVALLATISLAAVIGTVVPQGQPTAAYVDQFGPLWAGVFGLAGLDHVYSAAWFVLMLALLMASTGLCIWRTAPRLLADWRAFRADMRVSSLQAFGHRAEGERAGDARALAARAGHALAGQGWRVRTAGRGLPDGTQGWMVAAQKGGARKLGYVATHGAIVLIGLGGLLDSDLALRGQMWLKGVTPYEGGGLVADVAAGHRLPAPGFSFRGQLAVAEGTRSGVALIGQGQGVVLQSLPFSIELKRFIVDDYPTGMPRRFASEVVLHDPATGERHAATVEVNRPAFFKGVRISQSGFEDGGSALSLRAVPLFDPRRAFLLQARVGADQPLAGEPGRRWTLEPTELRVVNVEPAPPSSVDPVHPADPRGPANAMDTASPVNPAPGRIGLAGGAAARPDAQRRHRDIGPSVAYRLRDDAGQAVEFLNYMRAVDAGDGVPVYLYGARLRPQAPWAYLRVPADVLEPGGGQADFWRIKTALGDAALRQRALDRYAEAGMADGRAPAAQAALRASAERVLDLFAGPAAAAGSTGAGATAGRLGPAEAAEAVPPPGSSPSGPPESGQSASGQSASGPAMTGLRALSDMLERQVPSAQRPQATRLLVEVLNGVLYQLLLASREAQGLAPVPSPPSAAALDAYMRLAVLALNDAALYPAPVLLELSGFEQVQASVLQVARTPGQPWVYLGCLLLVLGVFAMLYVRDRRLWLWVAPLRREGAAPPASTVRLAYACNRQTLEADREFAQWRGHLLGPENVHDKA